MVRSQPEPTKHKGRSKRGRVGKAGTLVWLGHTGESPGTAVFRVRIESFSVWLRPGQGCCCLSPIEGLGQADSASPRSTLEMQTITSQYPKSSYAEAVLSITDTDN